MMINQAIEKRRGDERHGSCGIGVNETVRRSRNEDFKITAVHLMPGSNLHEKLYRIRDTYVPARLKELGLTPEDLPHLHNHGILSQFQYDAAMMVAEVNHHGASDFFTPWSVWGTHEDIVFEGAQGLRLDQDSPDFPYVTHSKTGTTNVLELLNEVGHASTIDAPLRLYYLTRPYFTRHGAGPLPNELERVPYEKILDKTNIENPHQGKLRFAHLDLKGLFDTIQKDLFSAMANPKTVVDPTLVLTCVDQLDDRFHLDIMDGKQKVRIHTGDIFEEASDHGFRCIETKGPTRETVGIFAR
jgi:adenylosuccinate synthase